MPSDALESTLGIRAHFAVLAILLARRLAKILAAIVQRASVPVFRVLAFFAPKDFTGHGYSAIPLSVETLGEIAPCRAPVPLIKPFEVGCVDDGNLIARKRNVAVRFIEWLRNGMPLDSAFRHKSSSQGFVQRSHFISSAVVLAVLIFAPSARAQFTTPISDTLFTPVGGLANGTITISDPTGFTAADGSFVPANSAITVNVSQGALSVSLVPNIGSNPSGSYYRASYSTTAGNYTEIWIVPQSSSAVKLLTIRARVIPNIGLTAAFDQLNPPAGAFTNCFPQWLNPGWGCSSGGGGGGGGANITINGGSALPSPVNFQNGTGGNVVNGIGIVFSNPNFSNVQAAISGTLTVPGGGSGATTFSAHGVLLGEGSAPFSTSVPSANQQCFMSAPTNYATTDPSFQSCPGGGNVSNSGTPSQYQVAVWAGPTTILGVGPGTAGYPLLGGGSSANPAFAQLNLTTGVTGTLPYANGGAGATGYTTNCILKAGASAFACSSMSDNATLILTSEGVSINPGSTSQVGLIVNNPSGTSADIAEFQVNGVTVARIDASGYIYAAIGSGVAGQAVLPQGTAPSITSGAVTITVGTSVTGYNLVLAGAAGTGIPLLTNSSNIETQSFLTSTAAGDLVVGTGSTWQRLAGNSSGTAEVLQELSGVASWVVPSGGSCSTCIIQVPTTTAVNTIAPTANGVAGLTVVETTGTGTPDIADFCPTSVCSASSRVAITSGGSVTVGAGLTLGGGMAIDNNGSGNRSLTFSTIGDHISSTGSGGCVTTPNDICGTIAISSSTTGSKTFTTSYGAAPTCVVSLVEATAGTIPGAGAMAYIATTTSIRVDVTNSGSYSVAYHCFQ